MMETYFSQVFSHEFSFDWSTITFHLIYRIYRLVGIYNLHIVQPITKINYLFFKDEIKTDVNNYHTGRSLKKI